MNIEQEQFNDSVREYSNQVNEHLATLAKILKSQIEENEKQQREIDFLRRCIVTINEGLDIPVLGTSYIENGPF